MILVDIRVAVNNNLLGAMEQFPQFRVIVSWDGDHIGRVVGLATLRDDVEEVRRVDQAINRGNEIFRSWALAASGSIIEIGGDEGRVEVPATALTDLESVRQRYDSAVDSTVSVGIGKKLSESARSLLAAKLRGGDRVVLWSPDVDKEVEASKEKSESEKIGEEYLGVDIKKADEGSAQSHPRGGVSTPHKSHPSIQTEEHSQGEVAHRESGDPRGVSDMTLAGFRAVADATTKRDRAAKVQQSSDYHDLKQHVADALQQLRTQLPVLNQIKSAYPDTYKSVLQLVQSVVGLARGLQTTDSTLTKAQSKPKTWKEKTDGFGRPIEIPSAQHPDRKRWDSRYLSQLVERYGKGSLRDIDIGALEAGNSGREIHSKSRFDLYSRMLSGGDKTPPIVVMPRGQGFTVVDGTHRLEAARATKTKTLPAMVIKKSDIPLDKALPDTKPAIVDSSPGHESFKYSHFLPENRQPGLTLLVHHHPEADHFTAKLYHEGKPVGHVIANIWDKSNSRSGEKVIEPHSSIDKEHRGKGLGLAMYEAAYTHAKYHLGVTAVEGLFHSNEARKVHERLSAKHGFEYRPEPRPNSKYFQNGSYSYSLDPTKKDEPDFSYDDSSMDDLHFIRTEVEPDDSFPKDDVLNKAISDIKLGKETTKKPRSTSYTEINPLTPKVKYTKYDYSHVLTDKQRSDKYGIVVTSGPKGVDRHLLSILTHNGHEVGLVCGIVSHKPTFSNKVRPPGITPHSTIDEEHRGKGLGVALYEAAYAHAKNHLGVNYADGGHHSLDASRVHKRLAAKHGFDYDPEEDDEEGSQGQGPYTYPLTAKAEGDFGLDESAMDDVHFSVRETLDKAAESGHAPSPGLHAKGSPVGTIHNGKIKVVHADGNSGWKGVRAGMIQGQEPGVPLFGANSHPVSSRVPGSK
jgi:GNAT superfamily N-acetyltransferase